MSPEPFSNHRPRRPPSLPSLLAVALAALTLASLTLAGLACRVSEDGDETVERTAAPIQEPTTSGEVRASVPIEGYRQVDLAQIDAGRLDESWRSSAERDRELRRQGGWPSPDELSEGGVARGAGGGRPAADGGTTAAGGGTPSSASAPGSTGGTAPGSAAAAGGAPIERLRVAVAGAAGGRRSPSGGTAAGGTAAGGTAAGGTAAGGTASGGTAAGNTAAGGPAAAGKAGASSSGAAGGTESWDDLGPDAFASFQPHLPVDPKGGGPTVLAIQQRLDRVRFSPGVIDGRWGKNTEKAVYWLQDTLGLESTGRVDADLFARLGETAGTERPVRRYRVSAEDLSGPFVDIPDQPAEQADLQCLCYGSAKEELAERFHATPELLAKLNPDTDLDTLTAGSELLVPDVEPLATRPGGQGGEAAAGGDDDSEIAEIVISKSGFYLQALDRSGQVLYHFPTTVGAGYDPSPEGHFKVTAVAFDPTFHYQPALFHDVPDSEPEAMLPAGANSPVGLVWMQLSKDNYGIHGTAEPATIGYTTSHGCVRLTNWDALFLARRLAKGTPVQFRGTAGEVTPG